MEIYKIIDREDENAYCSTTPYKNRSGAEKALNQIMKRHVRRLVNQFDELTQNTTLRGREPTCTLLRRGVGLFLCHFLRFQ